MSAMTAKIVSEPRAQPTGTRTTVKVSSECLMNGKREIIILHGLDEYHLRITAAGKLILTK